MTKKEKLQLYKRRDLNIFMQFDCFSEAKYYDDEIIPDKDGDSIWHTITQDLMSMKTVRVLIDPDAEQRDVVRGLKKIIKLIEERWKSEWMLEMVKRDREIIKLEEKLEKARSNKYEVFPF